MIDEEQSSIQSIQTSCSTALPVNLDINLPRCLNAQELAEQAVFLLLQQQQTLVLPEVAQQQREHPCC
jgi:hypothetical protein